MELKTYLKNLTNKEKISWLIVMVFIVIDVCVVGHYALGRYYTYHALAFDLGNMDQAVWNTLHGHPFRFTNRGDDWQGPPTRLGAHIEPILLAIAPLYLLYSGPQTLIMFQTIALALGSIPLFLLARKHLPTMPFVAVAFVIAYLIAPEVLGEGLFDFHPVALATPLLLTAIWAMYEKKYKVFAIASILAAFCKEEVALALIPLGLYLLIRRKKRVLGSLTIICSLAWVMICFFVIIPNYNNNSLSNYTYRYDWIEDSPFEIFQSPDYSTKQKYLTLLLRTGGGLSIFSPYLLLSAFPEIAINILSSKWQQYIGFYQYNAVIVPFMFAASVFGASELYKAKISHAGIKNRGNFYTYWQKTIRKIPIPSRLLYAFIIFCLLLTSYLNIANVREGLLLFIQNDNYSRPQQNKIDKLLHKIPPAASVATSSTLNAHLSDRYDLFLLPDPQSYTADYVAIDTADSSEMKKIQVKNTIQKMTSSKNYHLIGEAGGVIVLKRIR